MCRIAGSAVQPGDGRGAAGDPRPADLPPGHGGRGHVAGDGRRQGGPPALSWGRQGHRAAREGDQGEDQLASLSRGVVMQGEESGCSYDMGEHHLSRSIWVKFSTPDNDGEVATPHS